MVPVQSEYLQGLLHDGISWRGYQPRVWEYSGYVPLPPLDHLAWPCAAVNEQRQTPRQDDVHTLDRMPLVGQDFADTKLSKSSVSRQPDQFLSRR